MVLLARRRRIERLLVASSLAALAACNQVLHTGDYRESSGSASGPGGSSGAGGCEGSGGRACFACPATTDTELANACTSAACKSFDPARLTLLVDGSKPELPADASGGAAGSGGADGTAGTAGSGGSSDPACADLSDVVIVTGSSAAKGFLTTVGQILAGQSGAAHTTIVYQGQGSCVGVDAVLNANGIAGTATYWKSLIDDPNGADHSCTLGAGVVPDVAASDVFATTCFDLPQGLPATVDDTFGPVQVMTFVVPQASPETSISFDAAYFAYGFGAGSGVDPWNDESLLFQRSASSGTQNMIASFIGVPADRWKGKPHGTTDELKVDLLTAGQTGDTAAHALGILGADTADTLRGQVKVLALQAPGQSCGYWPDSTPTATDKKNVRDGHYAIWGPLHLLSRVNGSGAVQRLLGYLVGTTPVPGGLDIIQLYASRGLVPLCAMHVARTSDGGRLSPFSPQQPCGCHYDYVATGATDCPTCSTSGECPADRPTCSFGYCEKLGRVREAVARNVHRVSILCAPRLESRGKRNPAMAVGISPPQAAGSQRRTLARARRRWALSAASGGVCLPRASALTIGHNSSA